MTTNDQTEIDKYFKDFLETNKSGNEEEDSEFEEGLRYIFHEKETPDDDGIITFGIRKLSQLNDFDLVFRNDIIESKYQDYYEKLLKEEIKLSPLEVAKDIDKTEKRLFRIKYLQEYPKHRDRLIEILTKRLNFLKDYEKHKLKRLSLDEGLKRIKVNYSPFFRPLFCILN